MNVLEICPTPWKVIRMRVGAFIEDANGGTILIMGQQHLHIELLKFIVETINNSARLRITDAKCECFNCEWQGTIYNCRADIDGDGHFGCPRCSKLIEVLA